MNPLEERLNDQLEQLAMKNRQCPGGLLFIEPARAQQPDIDEFSVLAQYLQQNPQIQIMPDFARQLERRMLRRQRELRLGQGNKWFSLPTFLRTHRALSSVLAACLLLCLFSTSLLALAARTTSPSNPLYLLKRWEQHVQIQFTSPDNQVTLHFQLARDDLKTLSSLADANHKQAYEQTLLDLDQQINNAEAAIKNVPPGPSHDHLIGDLASLKTNIRQTLRLLLSRLTFPERLVTTSELARVGDIVPLLTNATVTLPASTHGIATISLEGKNIAANAQLLVDGRVIGGGGTLRHGLLTFEVNWNGNQHPQNLGILNPDGTAAQIAVITTKKGNGNGNGTQPTGTPTPNGNRPTSTPTPHH